MPRTTRGPSHFKFHLDRSIWNLEEIDLGRYDQRNLRANCHHANYPPMYVLEHCVVLSSSRSPSSQFVAASVHTLRLSKAWPERMSWWPVWKRAPLPNCHGSMAGEGGTESCCMPAGMGWYGLACQSQALS